MLQYLALFAETFSHDPVLRKIKTNNRKVKEQQTYAKTEKFYARMELGFDFLLKNHSD